MCKCHEGLVPTEVLVVSYFLVGLITFPSSSKEESCYLIYPADWFVLESEESSSNYSVKFVSELISVLSYLF